MNGQNMEDDSFQSAKYKTIRYLGYRARSEEEVKNYLSKLGYPLPVISKVLNWAREYRFLDDSEFAYRWVETRRRLKPMGKLRLRQELLAKGITEDIIADSLLGLSSEEEYLSAFQMAESRVMRSSRPVSPERVLGWLGRRGYPADVCYRVVRELADRHRDDGKLLNS